jgi:hypothetical protein
MAKAFDPYHVWLGIPPEHRPPTYYRMLGIAPDEQDRDVIQAASLRLSAYVRNLQTGKHADDANRVLTELAEARSCLLDAASRARYDTSLAPAPARAAAHPPMSERPATLGRPRPAPKAGPPVIEMDELIVGDYHAPPVRAVALPAPRRRVGRVARETSPLVWILPSALGLFVAVVVAVLALRARTPETTSVIDGQFVATAPLKPSWQPAPLPPSNNQPQFNPPTMNSTRPPVIVERQPFKSPFRRPPSFGANSPMSPQVT